MMKFKNTDQKYAVEDHILWMYRATLEVELHVNTYLYLENLYMDEKLFSDANSTISNYHYSNALIKTSDVLKENKGSDERPSLNKFRDFLNGLGIKEDNTLKEIFKNIDDFYDINRQTISSLDSRRDAAAHSFKIKKSQKIYGGNGVSLNIQLKLMIEVREILKTIHKKFFDDSLDLDNYIDLNFYKKLYLNGIDLLRAQASNPT